MTFKIKDGVQIGTVNVFDNAGNLLVNAPSLTTTLVVAKGGTGATTLTGVVYGTGTTAMRAATAAEIVAGIGATAVANAAAVPWSGVSAKPTTLVGYGITDAALASHTHPAGTLATVTAAGATTATAVSFTNATASSSSSTGALVVSGGVGVGGALNVGSNLVVGGNLTVNGTTNSVNSTVSTLVDPVIDIGGGAGGAAPTGADTSGRGFKFQYFNGTAKSGFIGWDQADATFKCIPDAAWAGNVPSGVLGSIKAQNYSGHVTANDLIATASGSTVSLSPPNGSVRLEPTGTGYVSIISGSTRGNFNNFNINNSIIGGATPLAGTFTTLTATGTSSAVTADAKYLNINDDFGYLSKKIQGGTLASATIHGVVSLSTVIPTPFINMLSATYRSASIVIQVTQGAKYQVSTVNLIHDGTTVLLTEYGVIETNGSLATFTASISAGVLSISGTLLAGTPAAVLNFDGVRIAV